MNSNKTFESIKSLAKGDRVTIEALVTNLSFKKGAREELTFMGWFGSQPLFTRASGAAVPFFAFQAGHITLVGA